MSKLERMLKACVVVFLTSVLIEIWINFKSNFLSQGQLESLSLNRSFSINCIQNITMP